jgi:hypothetical protein
MDFGIKSKNETRYIPKRPMHSVLSLEIELNSRRNKNKTNTKNDFMKPVDPKDQQTIGSIGG